MNDVDATVDVPTALIDALRDLPQGVDDVVRIDRIRALEGLTAAVAAAQARESATFAASQRAAQQSAGVPEDRVGRGVAGQLGLARRVSPHQAGRYLGWATILVTELPHTFRALQDGRVSERRAQIVARETIWLSRVLPHAVVRRPDTAHRPRAAGRARRSDERRQRAGHLRNLQLQQASRNNRDGSHEVETVTPTGHRYRSRAPDPPQPAGRDESCAETPPHAA